MVSRSYLDYCCQLLFYVYMQENPSTKLNTTNDIFGIDMSPASAGSVCPRRSDPQLRCGLLVWTPAPQASNASGSQVTHTWRWPA